MKYALGIAINVEESPRCMIGIILKSSHSVIALTIAKTHRLSTSN